MTKILKKVLIDELELAYQMLEHDIGKDKVNDLTSEEISNLIRDNYDIDCTGRDIFLLHEPTINDLILDSEIHYGILIN